MTTTISAVYADGVFKPLWTPDFAEGASVRLIVTLDAGAEPDDDVEVYDRIRSAKSLDELMEAWNMLPAVEDPEYDEILKQLSDKWTSGAEAVTEAEAERRIAAAKAIEDLFADRPLVEAEDDDYDIERWIDESRRREGDIPKRNRKP